MTRPKLKLQLTPFDIAIEAGGWVMIAASFVYILITYPQLPDIIPIHYNAAGKIDGYGNKTAVLGLPAIALLLYSGMTALNKFPHIFNYLTQITHDNALREYTSATRMVRWLKFSITIIFGIITVQMVSSAGQPSKDAEMPLLPVVFVLTFLPIIYFIAKSIRK